MKSRTAGSLAAPPIEGLWAVSVDNSASVGSDIDATVAIRIAGDDETGVVPLMVGVVDLDPAGATVSGTIEPSRGPDFACEVDRGICLSAARSPKTDSIGQDDVVQLGKAAATVCGVPYATRT